MLTELALKKPKQRRIPELLAKEFGQLSLTCDEPDQLTIQEQCQRRFTPVRPRIFSAFGHRPNFTHADSFSHLAISLAMKTACTFQRISMHY